MTRLQAVHAQLHALLHARVKAHSLALQGRAAAPTPIEPALITRLVLEMQSIIAVEQSLGPRHIRRLNQRRWRQCLSLWRCQQVRWMLVERLIERLHKDDGAHELSALGRYLGAQPRSQARLNLDADEAGLSLAQRIALEEQVTRFGRLLNSQQRLDQARGL